MKLTREYLATYIYLESELKRIRRRIKHYEDNPLRSEHGVVCGSMAQFPYAECHFVVSGPKVKSSEERDKAVSQLLVNLKGNEKLYEDMKLDIEYLIESLPAEKAEIRKILTMKYIDRLSDYDIAAELHYDRSAISKKIDRFIDEVNGNSHISHS